MAAGPAGIDRRTALRAGAGIATAAGLGGIGLLGASPASAAVSRHTDLSFIISCTGWNARPPSATLTMSHNTTRKIIVHHTDFPNTTDYSRARAINLAHEIQNLHMDTNGWSDTGQHFTVSRGGYVLEGRHRSIEGLTAGNEQVNAAHCVGENSQAIGIENEGTYITETPTVMLWDSLVKLCTAICAQYGLGAQNIFGHWDYNETDCPGIAFYREFPQLRQQVAASLGQNVSQIPARTWPAVYDGNSGPGVTVAQYLLLNAGYQVPTTGVFTSDTVTAIQHFQQAHGFIVASDGTVTDPTWEALGVGLTPGATGPAVSGMQSILAHKGYPAQVTGTFDASTTDSVRAMQQIHGLPVNGNVYTSTWCALVGGIVAQEFS